MPVGLRRHHAEAQLLPRELSPRRAGDTYNPWDSGVLALPRFSAIVTSYNSAACVASAPDSVAAQDYPNLECIVVDDASKDNSVAVIEDWLARNGDWRFRLIAVPVNRGQLSSIAEALAVADSEFVAVLDADDFWLPGFVRPHVQAHLNTEACSSPCSDLVQVDRDGRIIAVTARWRALTSPNGKIGMPVAASALPRVDSNGAIWVPSEPSKVRLVPRPVLVALFPDFGDDVSPRHVRLDDADRASVGASMCGSLFDHALPLFHRLAAARGAARRISPI